jgi:uncharacterized Zn-binding protein involved in type VI secretion
MPGIVRTNVDDHIGHASPSPNPFHRTSYEEGSSSVYVNGEKAVRIGDKTYCGDPATGGSPSVFINNIAVHRTTDPTGGHGTWPGNSAATGSTTVYANGVGSDSGG